MCDFTIKLNSTKIKKINNNAIKSLEGVVRDIVEDADIPVDSGNLKNNITITRKNNTITITQNAPYAARQYFHPEYNHSNGEANWFEEYINGSKNDFLIESFSKRFDI
jgi:hypothetical protein